MPLLNSFKVDHIRMYAPAVCVAETMTTPKGDTITASDLRPCIPNKEILSEKGIHTLEYLFAGFMHGHLNDNGVGIIGISPMGRRTGSYIGLIGMPDKQKVVDAWLALIQDVSTAQDQSKIPELNEYQCGTCLMYSLAKAQKIAQNVLTHKVVVNKNGELSLDENLLSV